MGLIAKSGKQSESPIIDFDFDFEVEEKPKSSEKNKENSLCRKDKSLSNIKALAFIGRSANPCRSCRGLRHWVSTAQTISCEHCTPPARQDIVALRLTLYKGKWEQTGMTPADFSELDRKLAIEVLSKDPRWQPDYLSYQACLDAFAEMPRQTYVDPPSLTSAERSVINWLLDWLGEDPSREQTPPADIVESRVRPWLILPGSKPPPLSSDIVLRPHYCFEVSQWTRQIEEIKREAIHRLHGSESRDLFPRLTWLRELVQVKAVKQEVEFELDLDLDLDLGI